MSLAILLHELVHRTACYLHTLHGICESHVAFGAFCYGGFTILDGYFDRLSVNNDGTDGLTTVGAATYHGNHGLNRVHDKRDDAVADLSFGKGFATEHVVEERGLRVAKVTDDLDFSLCLCLGASCQADGSKHGQEEILFHCVSMS